MDTNFLDELNIAQKKAVENTDGPVLIVAGPGSCLLYTSPSPRDRG